MEDVVSNTYKRTKKDWSEFFMNSFMIILVYFFFMLIPVLGEYVFGTVLFLGTNIWDVIKLSFVSLCARGIGEELSSLEDFKYKEIIKAEKELEGNGVRLKLTSRDVFDTVIFICALRIYGVYGQLNWLMYVLFALSGLFSASILIDLKIQELPDSITSIFLIIVAALYVVGSPLDMQSAVLRALIMEVVYSILASIGGLGFGDVKLLFPISMCFSYIECLDFWMYTLIATFIYLIPAVILHKRKGLTLKGFKFAFGPFIIVGFFITIVAMLTI